MNFQRIRCAMLASWKQSLHVRNAVVLDCIAARSLSRLDDILTVLVHSKAALDEQQLFHAARQVHILNGRRRRRCIAIGECGHVNMDETIASWHSTATHLHRGSHGVRALDKGECTRAKRLAILEQNCPRILPAIPRHPRFRPSHQRVHRSEKEAS